MSETFMSISRRLLLGMSAALALAACGGGGDAGDAADNDEGVVLQRGNGAEPNTLDPHQANGTWENNIIGDMLIGLFTENSEAKPVFGSAVSHDISEDGLTHTFKIREDMLWSDGVPVTAGDFVFAWQRILDPQTAAPYATLLFPYKNARAIIMAKCPLPRLAQERLMTRPWNSRWKHRRRSCGPC